MPWTSAQNRLFRAIEHGWTPPSSSGIHIKRADATRMAHEGVKRAQGGLARFAAGGEVDPQLDPRSRALKVLNDRIAGQSSQASSMRATMDITRPLQGRRRLTMQHMADPWASMYLQHTPLDTAMGYGRYPTPDHMADGGQVEDEGFLRRHPWVAGGAAAALAGLRPKVVNSIARPFSRALSKPVVGVEAVSNRPLSALESDARYNFAREDVPHEFRDRPVFRGQGAWSPGEGEPMQFNPLYAQQLPRTLGRMIDAPEHMRYASQLGENLEQTATPVSRFVPHLWNSPEGANAMEFSGIDEQKLRALATKMGSGWVAAHRPGNRAMAFPLSDEWSLAQMARRIEREMPGVRTRYGRSDPKTDRVLLSREPLGYEDALYSQHGAVPRDEAYEAVERSALRSPELWSNLRGAK